MRMNSLLLNAGMNGVAQGVSKLIRFGITSIALVRYGAASWGEIAFALTVLTYLNFVLDFGLSSLALIERPDDKGLDRKFYIALSYVRGFLILAMFALAAGATCLFDISSGFILKAYLLQLFLKPFNFDWFLSRKGYTAYSPLVQTVRQVLILGVMVAVSMPSIENFVMLDVGTEILATFVLWVIGPKKEFRFGPPSRQELRGAMSCYRGSLILFVSSSLLLFHQNFDIFVLKYFVGNAAVGIYDYCFRYVMFIFVLGSSLSIPLRRQLARLKEANATDARSELVFCSHKVLGLLSAAFLFGTMCFSEKFFSVVVPVDMEFDPPKVIILFACWLVLSFYSVPWSEWLISQSRKRYLALAIVAGVVNIASNLLLVPAFQVSGAAVAKILSEVGIFVFLFLCVPPEMRRHIFRTAGIHVLLLPAVVWFFVEGSLPLWLMGVTAAAELLYIVLAKYITREDIRVLSRN